MPYPELINPVSEPKFPALIGRHTKFFKRFNLLLLVLVVLLGGFRLQQITTHFIRNQSAPSDYYQYDFGAYYDAAAALNLDQSQSIYNNPEFLKTAAKQSGMRTLFSAYIYPPFFAVILRPLALVPHLQAILIWAGLNLTWLCLAIFFTFKTIGIKISKFQWLVLILFLLIFPPVYHTIIIFGQVNLLLLFLLSIVLYGARKDASFTWQIIAGIALGIGIGIKIFFVILLIYYLFYGRPRLAISAGATFLVTILIGLVGASAINTTTYFSSILFDVSKVENNFWVNLSIEPTIHRLFSIVEYEYQLPHMAEPVVATLLPIIKSATAGKILGFAGKFLFAFLAGVYFISDWFFLRKDLSQFHDLLRVFFLLISFLLFMPLGWISTFVLIVVPIIILWNHFRSSPEYSMLLATILLIVYLLFLVNNSFAYLDYLLQRPLSTIFVTLDTLAILLLWATIGVILVAHVYEPARAKLPEIFDRFNIKYPVDLRLSFKNGLPLIGILILAFCLRLIAMSGKGLWYDELQSVTHASLPIPDLLTSVRTFDPHPALYYLLLHYWMKISPSDLWIKSSSILTAIITIVSIYFLAKKYFNRRTAILAALLFALAPYAINYGVEARNYSLWMLLAIWIFELNSRLLLSVHKIFWATGLFLISVAFLYLHGISFLILPAIYLHAFILLYRGEIRWRQLGIWLVTQVLILLAYIPWLRRAWTVGNVTPAVTPGIRDIVTTLYIHLFGYCNTCPISLQAIAIFSWLVICLVCIIRWPPTRIFILAYVFTPILATIGISYLIRPIWLFRGLGLIVPFMLLAIAVWLDRLLAHPNWPRSLAWTATAVTICLFALAFYNQQRTLVYPWDFKQAAQFVKSNVHPGEEVFLANERLFWVWNWYFIGPGKTNPIRTDYSSRSPQGIRVKSPPANIDPSAKNGFWQVYRDFDTPPVDTSHDSKMVWDFEGLIVEHIPAQP